MSKKVKRLSDRKALRITFRVLIILLLAAFLLAPLVGLYLVLK